MTNKVCEKCGFELQDNFLFCPGCGRDLQREGICKNCGHKNTKDSNFCQKCGDSLKQKFTPKAKEKEEDYKDAKETEIPPFGITVEFPYSSSQSFDFAVEESKKHPSFKQFGEGKKVVHRVTYKQEEMEAAAKLAEYLKGWRTRVVYVDGKKTTWDSVFSFTWCFEKKQASYKPEFYCYGYENEWQQNIWGCINSQLSFRDRDEWFCWGEFTDKKGTWKFDKDRIRHELEKNLFPYRFCPAFDEARLEAMLDAFPDEVNPIKDNNWKFVESWDEDNTPGLLVTVKRYGYKENVKMKGVGPNGFGAIKEIAKKIKFKIPLQEFKD